jgi:hypothetical protein
MTISDAKGMLTGGEDSATQYFRRTAGDELRARMQPIVARATAQVTLGGLYDRYVGKAAEFALMGRDEANLDDHVTGKALDGLYVVIADEERSIRKDPLAVPARSSSKVFGAL